jgi:hypothetical protein
MLAYLATLTFRRKDMATYTPDLLTARELAEMEYSKEQSAQNRAHELELAKLDYQVKKLEASWRQVFILPLALIYLPVQICLSVAALVAFAFGRDFPDALWNLLKSLGR